MNGKGRIPANYSSRSVRDGAIAAAIGVALSMALESGMRPQSIPALTTDTPWVASARVHMSTIRSGWQREKSWVIRAGWSGVSGKWGHKQK